MMVLFVKEVGQYNIVIPDFRVSFSYSNQKYSEHVRDIA